MKSRRILGSVLTLALVLLLAAGVGLVRAGAAPLAQAGGVSQDAGPAIATVTVTPQAITWHPLIDVAGVTLTVLGPDGNVWQQAFSAGEDPVFYVLDAAWPEGTYSYELVFQPRLSDEAQAALAAAAEPADREAVVAELQRAGQLPTDRLDLSGHFQIQQGEIVVDIGPEPGALEGATATNGATGIDVGSVTPPLDIVQPDDLIVWGSACIGYDCMDGEDFGLDILRLKEANLRIKFDDTSTSANFPANDWQIIANDSANGGASYLAIEDTTAGVIPFRIEAGALANSLYVGDDGHIGLGTATPLLELHIQDGNTPGVRLEQDGSLGWLPQTWDVAGNDFAFYVRDGTGNTLPFLIQSGAPDTALTVSASGSVGIGTWNPAYSLGVGRTGEDATLSLSRTDGATARLAATDSTVEIGSVTNSDLAFQVNGTTVMVLDGSGNLQIEGALTEASDVNRKENLDAVVPADVLARLAALPVYTWNYIGDDPAARHMGPTAQDFYAAFGLGVDDQHIAPLDANGVALAAIQELYEQLRAEEAETAQLRLENQELRQRLDALELLVAALLAGQAK